MELDKPDGDTRTESGWCDFASVLQAITAVQQQQHQTQSVEPIVMAKILSCHSPTLTKYIRLPPEVQDDVVSGECAWGEAFVCLNHATTELHFDFSREDQLLRGGKKLWEIWPPSKENLAVVREGTLLGNLDFYWARDKLKCGVLVIQEDKERLYLPLFAPHCVFSVGPSILFDLQLYMIQDVPGYICWADVAYQYSGLHERKCQAFGASVLQSLRHSRTRQSTLSTWRSQRASLAEF